MNVLYHTCYADPWIKVAMKLKEDYGYQPVFWIGYEDDHSNTLVKQAFPNCLFQDYFEAWKGIYPPEITNHRNDAHLDMDFIREYASFELQAIKMMDRMDPGRYSFNFTERQRHYRNILKNSLICLKHLQISLVICDYVPHRVSDYAFYLLCRFYRIPYVFFGISQFPCRFFPLTDLSSISSRILSDYWKIMKSGTTAESLKAALPEDIMTSYNKILQDYSVAKPEYERLNIIQDRQSSGMFSLMKKFFMDAGYTYKSNYFGPDGFFIKGIPTYARYKNRSVKKIRTSILQYSFNKLKANLYKKNLKKYYALRTICPDYSCNYIFLGLHYQPELTTSPSGDIFVDQRLCVEILDKYLPEDWLIYVKEHPAQFYSHLEGHTSRDKAFYDDLLSYKKVRLVPADSDPFEMIKSANAIATVTGTVGWEAMVLGKPVIAFGLSWYEKFEGVLKITDENSASRIYEFIRNFTYDEKKLFAYLTAFHQNSRRVYAHRAMREEVNIPESECIRELIGMIQASLEESKIN